MTPESRRKIEEESKKQCGCPHGYPGECVTKYIERGATFGYELGVRDVVSRLRENYVNGGKGMADFIEREFQTERKE